MSALARDGVRISDAAPRDAPILSAMHALCFPEDPWSSEALAGLLATPGTQGFLASRSVPDGLALVRCAADEAEVLTLGVLPSARNQGIGGQILDAVISSCARRRVRAVFLEVAVDNMPARRLYERRGFCEVGRRAGYYAKGPGPMRDALVLRLDVGTPHKPL